MQSTARTVSAYLKSLPTDRRAALSAVRRVILANLDEDYEEGMQYGVIGYYVPHRVFPEGYHADPKLGLPFAALASQKHYMSLYLMGLYCGCEPGMDGSAVVQWFQRAWAATGKRLDMGKACIRFKRLEDLPLPVVGEAIRRVPASVYIKEYQRARRAIR